MSINMFMEYGNQVIQFPVNPEEIEINIDGNNDKAEVVKLGEVNIAKDKKLLNINFEGLLPNENIYPFILTKNKFQNPKFYIDFIDKVRQDKKPVRFLVSDTNINLLALIDKFSYRYVAGSEDIEYSISLSEYKDIKPKIVTIAQNNTPNKQTSSSRPNPTEKKVTIGCSVIVNGRLHKDSFGKGPGKTLKNYSGKVNFIKNGRGYPYHVTTPNGSWLGWVTKGSVKVK